MNPFIISSYKKPSFFCNRENETENIINSIVNGRNLVLSSLRRMGKTGLIKHVFYMLHKANEQYLFYIDIDQTSNLNDFINALANSLIQTKRKKLYEKVFEFLKALRPVFTFNPITGQPEVEIRQEGPQQDMSGIESIFNYLETLDKPVIIAIDEFQRITSYPEGSVEGFLRSHIQHLNNVQFIFSGSSQQLLQSMFNDQSRPFYQSAGFMHLGRLDKQTYAAFVKRQFEQTGRSISINDIELCIDWADNHTFYSQFLFNNLWGSGVLQIGHDEITQIQEEIIESRDAWYSNFRYLLTSNQYQLLQAIAIDKEVNHPNSMDFINTHKLGSISTVNSALKVLIEKQLVYREMGKYKLYDVFQSHWFRQRG